MPDFWEFPTVSMGLGPITALYHARFNRYLQNRQLDDTSQSRVWAFLGDGECDEPETLGALSLASREQLDNLIFVVNCNLQRLDGPVRGNGKIIQELEAMFRGAGWNVIKVIWGSKWDELLAKDKDGVLLNKMNTTVDGEFQRYGVESGAYIRDHFFGPDPRLRQMVAAPHRRRAASTCPAAATTTASCTRRTRRPPRTSASGAPTAILCKTIKGWTLGPELRGPQRHPPDQEDDQGPAARCCATGCTCTTRSPTTALDGDEPPYYRPPEDSIEYQYMMERRQALGGSIPKRIVRAPPAARAARRQRRSPSCAAVRASRRCRPRWASPACCATWPATSTSGRASCRSSPTRPARSAWTRCSASSRSTPRRARSTSRSTTTCCSATPRRPTARSSRRASPRPARWPASSPPAPRYATRGVPMVPFYTFYSMFGFQRVGDLIWQAADARTRGFLLGATAGRTTLLGEGLQHQDGHTLVLASTVPAVPGLRPGVRLRGGARSCRQGIQRMYGGGRPSDPDVFYYLTLYNENYPMPAMPDAAAASRTRSCSGLYRWQPAPGRARRKRATILFSGSAHGAARAGGRRAGRALRRRRRAVVGDVVQGAARGGADGRAVEPPAPRPGARGRRSSPRCSATRRARSSPSPTS